MAITAASSSPHKLFHFLFIISLCGKLSPDGQSFPHYLQYEFLDEKHAVFFIRQALLAAAA